ncbi:MAG TPA: EF-Tu/IF-2/RF-3 family GTPase [Thermoplasmata archaeon]|nr:EF-Tu/IF-2/RF-3 family GTPase [Thermoplasmata archaeon]
MAGSAVTIALLGASDELARSLGKRGTQSDLTLYNAVRDGHAATLVAPGQFPEKLAPLLYALAMSDRALLVVGALDRPIAEMISTLDVFGPPVTVVRGAAVGVDELRRATKGSRLEGAAELPLEVPQLKEWVDTGSATERPGPVRVRLDHAFPVKGVGAVALGLVAQGRLEAHAKLRLYPTDRLVEVRSIQVHDVEVDHADGGDRVGVALRGVDAEELARGQVLAAPESLRVGNELVGNDVRRNRYYRGELHAGEPVNLLLGLQWVAARVGTPAEGQVRLTTDRSVAFDPGDRFVVADLDVVNGPRTVLSAAAT